MTGANSGPRRTAAGADEEKGLAFMTASAVHPPTLTSRTSASRTSRFGHASHLSCRECGQTYRLGATHVCAECFGPLEVAYNFPELTRASIEAGPDNIWRYASLLPVPADVASGPNRSEERRVGKEWRSGWVGDD